MRVTIIGHYTDSNKGSCAVSWGLIKRLRQTGVVDSICLVSLLDEHSPLFASSFRFIQTKFPDISCFAYPFLNLSNYDAPVRRLVGVLSNSLKLSVFTPAALSNDRASLKAILESDLLITRGGPFFAASSKLFNASLMGHALPLLFAKKAGIPYGFAPESVGPLNSFMSRFLVKSLFAHAAFITVREGISKNTLRSIGIDDQKIHVMLDSAFYVEPELSQQVKDICNELAEGRFLAVVCRGWKPSVMEKYHKALAQVIDAVVPEMFPNVALILNTYSPEGRGDDRAATRQLYSFIAKKQYVRVIEDDLSPPELVALYGKARLVLGTRLHSVILALAGGTPVLAVSYLGHKTHGVMQLLGLGQFVVDMTEFSEKWARDMMERALSEQRSVSQRIENIRRKNDETFQMLIENVARGRGIL